MPKYDFKLFSVCATALFISGCSQIGFVQPSDIQAQPLAEGVIVDFTTTPSNESISLGRAPIRSAFATLLLPANRPLQGNIVIEISRISEFYDNASFQPWSRSVEKNQVVVKTITGTNGSPLILPEVKYAGVSGSNITFIPIDLSSISVSNGYYVIAIRTKNDLYRSRPIKINEGRVYFIGETAPNEQGVVKGDNGKSTVTEVKSINKK